MDQEPGAASQNGEDRRMEEDVAELTCEMGEERDKDEACCEMSHVVFLMSVTEMKQLPSHLTSDPQLGI